MNIEMKPVNRDEMRVMGKEKRSASKLFVVLTMLAGFVLAGAAQAAQTVTYYHSDALGSAVAASDESGNLVWRKSYEPYGEKLTDGEAESNAIAYTGKKHDDITGLTYFGARYYDPEIGRFMGMDPAQFTENSPVSFNRFAYANNNPYKFIDPDGRTSIRNMLSGAQGGAAFKGKVQAQQQQAAYIKRLSENPKIKKIIEEAQKTYQTYTKTNPKTGEVYCGRTSGCGTPGQNLTRRDNNHHMNKEGFGPAALDKTSSNAAAIRGREQQLIKASGGAKSTGGTSGNRINGVSPKNPKRNFYKKQAKKEFGE